MALVKNKITGSVTEVPDHYLEHPILGADLEAYTGEEIAEEAKVSNKKEQIAPETTK
jgi:hypothetical protein